MQAQGASVIRVSRLFRERTDAPTADLAGCHVVGLVSRCRLSHLAGSRMATGRMTTVGRRYYRCRRGRRGGPRIILLYGTFPSYWPLALSWDTDLRLLVTSFRSKSSGYDVMPAADIRIRKSSANTASVNTEIVQITPIQRTCLDSRKTDRDFIRDIPHPARTYPGTRSRTKSCKLG